jgi:hypothetical protein
MPLTANCFLSAARLMTGDRHQLVRSIASLG